MEAIEQERKWHLVRNDNGEWISDENVVFLTSVEARSLQIKARLAGKKLDIQHGPEGELWCYKHEIKTIKFNLEMKTDEKRTDDYCKLKVELPMIDLPKGYTYHLDKRDNLTLKVLEKGLKANMQDNESAFESWAIVLKFYLKDIKTVTIDWDDLSIVSENNLHFNRFVYRLTRFVQSYEWAFSKKPIPQLPSILVCNYPNGDASKADEHEKGSEGWIECKYVEKHKIEYDVMDHQLPVGIFYDKVSRKTHFTTGQKSAIDIWAIKDGVFSVFELKKPNNIVLGIISELMFYTNIIHDIMSHRIQFQEDAKMQAAINNNYRGFADLYKAYLSGSIQKINAVLLADSLHPLIKPELLDFINDSARFRYSRISFSMKEVSL